MTELLNRSEAPSIKNIDSIHITEPQIIVADNGININILNIVNQDMIRIDLMFHSGKWEQEKLLVSMFANLLLKEGSKKYKSTEITEALDFCGASIQCSATFHNSYVTLYTLNKHLSYLLPILEDVVKNPTYPREEFEVIKDKRKQSFIIDDNKVDVISYNKYIELLFGNTYPYGTHANLEDFDNVAINDLKDYHSKHYNSDNCTIILTGKLDDNSISEIKECFGKDKWGNNHISQDLSFSETPSEFGRYFVEKKDALQSSIRIGTKTIGRMHEDYSYLRIVNTILGGYFGSRLMSNIREDKGYTYGIGSNITTLKNASFLSISTQTGNEYKENVIKEIFYEIERLKTELVADEELDMVKGYLMGEMLRLFDGPFSIADAHQALIANNMTVDYYYNMIDAIKTIDSKKVLEISQKYFDTNKFYTIVCGAE